jgi:hypothetical protein
MTAARATVPRSPVALAWLVATSLFISCADQDNPVLPSSGGIIGPGGSSTGARSDAGTTVGDVGAALPDDALSGGGTGVEPGTDALFGSPCDLLKQNCVKTSEGCYPVGGKGICLPSGLHTALMTCLADTDCDRGLVCLPTPGLGDNGLCEPICERTGNGVPAICPGQICATRGDDFPTGVGLCSSS